MEIGVTSPDTLRMSGYPQDIIIDRGVTQMPPQVRVDDVSYDIGQPC